MPRVSPSNVAGMGELHVDQASELRARELAAEGHQPPGSTLRIPAEADGARERVLAPDGIPVVGHGALQGAQVIQLGVFDPVLVHVRAAAA